ncbi:PIN domain-like protein [Cunninghamella echinulata]|nr:PIN domain-like protein [Cunninghamella echinulata]
MGIQGLTTLLKRYAPQSLNLTLAHHYRNKVLAIDASCHLNKYIYGEDRHPYKHIYGFYQLARFCDKHAIIPLFVFDGKYRLAAKQQWEGRRREKARYKIDQSLLFEMARSSRLDNWLTVLQSDYISKNPNAIPLPVGRRILKKLDHVHDIYKQHYNMDDDDDDDDNYIDILLKKKATTTKNKTKKINMMKKKNDQNDNNIDKDYQLQQIKEQKKIERKLVKIAKELGQTLDYVQDKEKYTKTVRALSSKEYQLMTTMIQDKIENIKNDIHELQYDNDQMITSLTKRSVRITHELREECKTFLSSLGYVCFTSEHHEAEALCANLVKNGKADGTISEDLDTVAFGDTLLLRYFFAKKRPILQVDPIKARQQLELTKEQFLDLCILCGTDFGPKIKGVGPIRALQLIQKYGSIENILKELDTQKYIPEPGFDFKNIRKIFQELPTIPMDEKAYIPPLVDPITVNNLLNKYEIDPAEANEQLELILHQDKYQHNSDINTNTDFGKNPFQPSYHLSI